MKGSHRRLDAFEQESWKVLFSLSHLCSFLFSRWKLVFFTSLCFALFLGGLASLRAVRYDVSASFRVQEPGPGRLGIGTEMVSFVPEHSFQMDLQKNLLLSRRILEPVIHKLNLQVSIRSLDLEPWETFLGLVERKWGRIRETLAVEFAGREDYDTFFAPEGIPYFSCTQVRYEADGKGDFVVEFLNDTAFLLKNTEGRVLGKGTLGEAFSSPEVDFTLSSPRGLLGLEGRKLRIRLAPVSVVAESLASQIKVKQDLMDPKMVHLSLCQGNRHLAARILNEVVQSYQNFLVEGIRKESREKLAFLEQRKTQMDEQLGSFLSEPPPEETVRFGTEVFLDYETQLKVLSERREKFLDQLSKLDRRIAGYDNYSRGMEVLSGEEVEEVSGLSDLLAELRDVEQARDSLGLEMAQMALRIGEASSEEAIVSLPPAAQFVLAQPREVDHFKPSQGSLLGWYHRVHSPSTPAFASLRTEYPPQSKTRELTGMSLASAKEIYAEAQKKLVEWEGLWRNYSDALELWKKGQDRVTSVANLISDPVNLELVGEMRDLQGRIELEEYYTDVELRHFKGRLAYVEGVFRGSLEDRISFLSQQQKREQKRVHSLQATMGALLNREERKLREQIRTSVTEQKAAVEEQALVLTAQLNELEEHLQRLPSKRAEEQAWEARKLMAVEITQEIAEVTEAMSVFHHMAKGEFQAVDTASPTVLPQPPRVLRFAIVGGVFGGGCCFGILLAFGVIYGFPARPANLAPMGALLAGDLRGDLSDLDSLRYCLQEFDQSRGQKEEGVAACAALLLGEGPDYAERLADLLVKREEKVVVIEAPPCGKEDSVPPSGLIRYLKNPRQLPKLEQRNGYDFLPAGGPTPYVSEALTSKPFFKLIDRFSESHDWVLVKSKASLTSVDAQTFLDLYPLVAVTLVEEDYWSLRPYLDKEEWEVPPKVVFFSSSVKRRGE